MNLHFSPDYSERALLVARIIGALDYRELLVLNEAISNRFRILDAEAASNFKPGDKVTWRQKKHSRVYRYSGTILSVGPRSKILTAAGGEHTVPTAWLEHDDS